MNEPLTSSSRVSAENEIDLLDVCIVLAQNARLLVLGSLLIGIVALGITYLISPIYTATTRVLPPQQQQQGAAALLAQQLGSLAGLAGAGGASLKNPADIYVAMLQSRTVADRLVEHFGLVALYEVAFRQDARKRLAQLTKIKAGKDSVITIEVNDHDRNRAAAIANAYVAELQELTKTLAVGEAAQRRVFFESQLKQAKDNLTNAEIALRGSGVGESALKVDPGAAVEGIARLRAQITAAEVRQSSMRGYLTDNSVEIRQTQQELTALHAQLAKFETSELGGAQERGAEYVGRYRNYKYFETLFELMAKQYELARLDEAREGTLVQVIDPAQAPERRSSPKRTLTAIIITLLSFVVLAIFVFVRQAYDAVASDPGSSEKIHRILNGLRGAVGWGARR